MMADKKKDSTLLSKVGRAALAGAGFVVGGVPGAAAGYGAFEGGRKAVEARGKASDRSVNPVRQSREMLSADVEALRNDPASLGMTEAERQAKIAEATQQAAQLQQAQTAQLSRAALAGQDFQAGALRTAARDVSLGGEAAAAAAARDTAALNQKIIESESNRIRAALAAERERVKENTRYWTQFGIDTAGGLVAAAMGMPGIGDALGGVAPMVSAPATPAAPAPAPPPVDGSG